MNTVHRPQVNSPERATMLHIRRNRQALRDARRGHRWMQTLSAFFAARDEHIPTLSPHRMARLFAHGDFTPVPKTGWRARARAEAEKAKAA